MTTTDQLHALLAFHTSGRAACLATQVRLTGTAAAPTALRVRWARAVDKQVRAAVGGAA